jgi:hypothetical protein
MSLTTTSKSELSMAPATRAPVDELYRLEACTSKRSPVSSQDALLIIDE